MAVCERVGADAGTSKPVTPGSTTSGLPPTCVVTTGKPARHRFEQCQRNPFGCDGKTKTLARDSRRRNVATSPWNFTWPGQFNSASELGEFGPAWSVAGDLKADLRNRFDHAAGRHAASSRCPSPG